MLDVDGLTYRYGNGTVAVADLSFAVHAGSVCALAGRNGAGKTTTMRAVVGLLPPAAGRVCWDGRPVGLAERQGFSYFQAQGGLFPRMTVTDQLVYIGRIHGMTAKEAAASTARWLDRLGAAAFATRPLETLSDGQQQRVHLASCFLHQPTLAVLDEPFTLLDVDGVALLSDVLRELAGAGTAVLVSSHQLDLLEELCDALVIVDKGRLVVAGRVDDLRAAATQIMRLRFAEPVPPGWLGAVKGVTVVADDGCSVVLHLGPDTFAAAVVSAADAAGRVTECSWSPPRLRELYRDVLAATS